MSWTDIVPESLDVRFDIFGKDSTYTPPSAGTPVTCKVIRNSADRELGGGFVTKAITEGITIDVRKSEIAAPAKGGSFAIDAEAFEIVSDPKTDDADRLIWSCTVRQTA